MANGHMATPMTDAEAQALALLQQDLARWIGLDPAEGFTRCPECTPAA